MDTPAATTNPCGVTDTSRKHKRTYGVLQP